MVCYTIPLSVAIILFVLRKVFRKKNYSLYLLNLLLGGGAVMLVIDHFWNGELFLIGENIASDLALGIVMTTGAFVFWGIVVVVSKTRVPTPTEFKT